MAANEKFQDYCLKWNNYYSHLSGAFLQLLESESMVDVTLSAGGEKIRAHRIVLSASSPYFQELLASAEDAHPTVILSDVNAEDMKAVLEFVYRGELCVMANRFASVLKVADDLKIKGLSEVSSRLPGLEGMINGDNVTDDSVPNGNSVPGNGSLLSNSSNNAIPNCNSAEEEEKYSVASQEMREAAKIEKNEDAVAEMDISQRERCQLSHKEGDIKADESPGAMEEIDLASRDDSMLSVKEDVDSCIETGSKTTLKRTKPSVRTLPRYVERCEGVVEIAPRKKLRKQRYRKEYSEESLCEALAELRRGRPLMEAAAAHHIPRSTLYVRARSSGIQLPLTRQEYAGEMVSAAVQAVQGGSSLKRASDHFKIPKTVLWRKVQRELESGSSQYKKLEKSSRSPYTSEQRQAAIEALIRGDNIAKVYREYQIPKTTLFRERARLVACGRIPGVVQRGGTDVLVKRGNLNHEKLELAVAACQKRGMTHALAALTYQVPKTTLWRRLQQLRKAQGDSTEYEGASGNAIDISLKKETDEEMENTEEDKEMEVVKTLAEEIKQRTRLEEDSLRVEVVESEVTVKEDGTVSFVAEDGSSDCTQGLQFPPGSSLIILTTGESIQLQEGEQIIVETDTTEQ